MDLFIDMRSSDRKNLIEACVKLYAKELKIDKNHFNLIVYSCKNLAKKEGADGVSFAITNKCYSLVLNSQMVMEKMIQVLAHEMIHIKQLAKGQLKRKGRQTFWMGKKYVHSKVNYYDQPWEHDAWSKERMLAGKIFKILLKANEKFNRNESKA